MSVEGEVYDHQKGLAGCKSLLLLLLFVLLLNSNTSEEIIIDGLGMRRTFHIWARGLTFCVSGVYFLCFTK